LSLYRYDPPAGVPMEGFMRASVDGPVVCGSCGCRLQPPATSYDSDGEQAGAWRHFEGLPGRDARGCRIGCVDLAHDRDGHVLS